MKKSIVKNISITGVLVVISALFIFSILTIFIYQSTMEQNINRQLVIENRIAYNLLLVDKLDDSAVYKFLSESQNLVFTKKSGEKVFTLMHSTDESFNDINIEKILKEYIQEGKKVVKYERQGNRYLMTISTNRSIEQKANSIIVSFISMEEIYGMTANFIGLMIIIALLLSIVSIIAFNIISKRITEPILKVINITKEYENRNFEETYIANTEDEIQELSMSINKMAKSLQNYDSEKEKLFRTISHEIKTPLTSIYGYAEGMKNGVFKDFDKPLRIIMEESMRIKTMTEDYIFLSKLESQIEVFSFKSSNIAEPLERAIRIIESLAIVKDIDIDYTPVQIPNIDIDADKIYRCFLNILTNAIKYTKSEIRIKVNIDDTSVSIRIEDNGQGLKDVDLNKFHQGLSSEKTNGSGVGLFITEAIVRQHKGRFVLGNNEREGAFFEIILNRKR